jgi:nucleoside-diphosphate-sugar epimerase
MRKIALVTGGSGFVGGRLIEMLRADGWTVRAIGRSRNALAKIEKLGAEPVEADLADIVPLAKAARDCTSVYHTAAFFKLWGPEKKFHEANVEGTAHLLAACQQAESVQRFVQVGAAAVVMGDPAPLLRADETLPLQLKPWAPYSSSKARSEHLVLQANGKNGMSTTVIRPPLIWGRGMPMLDQFKELIAVGRFRWPGDGSQPVSTCHVDNVCHAAILAAESTQGGRAYFVSDGEDGTLSQVFTDILATQGIKPPTGRTPFALAWAIAPVLETIWRVLALKSEPPVSRQMLRMIGQPFTVDIRRAQRELGYKPVVSWREGLEAM